MHTAKACLECGHSWEGPLGPCPKCNSGETIGEAYLIEKWGLNWRAKKREIIGQFYIWEATGAYDSGEE